MIHNMYFYLQLIFTLTDVIGLVMFQAEIISVSFQHGKNKLSFKSPDWGGLGGDWGDGNVYDRIYIQETSLTCLAYPRNISLITT